jgi:Ca2+-binding RTX toxin-like protein
MSKRSLGLLVALGMTSVAAVGSAYPGATTAFVANGVLEYQAHDGVANVVTISGSAPVLTIVDSRGIISGPGCTSVNPTKVTCSGVTVSGVIALEDGNDVFTSSAVGVPLYVYGADGNDTLSCNDFSCGLFGDSGNDTLRGGPGDDLIFGGDGRDTISGGAGNDNLDGQYDIDTVSGGDGDDIIFSYDGFKESVSCGAGNDSISPDHSDVVSGCESFTYYD